MRNDGKGKVISFHKGQKQSIPKSDILSQFGGTKTIFKRMKDFVQFGNIVWFYNIIGKNGWYYPDMVGVPGIQNHLPSSVNFWHGKLYILNKTAL